MRGQLQAKKGELKATKDDHKIEVAGVKAKMMEKAETQAAKKTELIQLLKAALKERDSEETRLKGRIHFLEQVRLPTPLSF